MALVDELRDTLAWIDTEHRAARAECERLLTLHRSRPPGTTSADARESMRIAVDVAAATARLETWNELRAQIAEQALSLFSSPAEPTR